VEYPVANCLLQLHKYAVIANLGSRKVNEIVTINSLYDLISTYQLLDQDIQQKHHLTMLSVMVYEGNTAHVLNVGTDDLETWVNAVDRFDEIVDDFGRLYDMQRTDMLYQIRLVAYAEEHNKEALLTSPDELVRNKMEDYLSWQPLPSVGSVLSETPTEK